MGLLKLELEGEELRPGSMERPLCLVFPRLLTNAFDLKAVIENYIVGTNEVANILNNAVENWKVV